MNYLVFYNNAITYIPKKDNLEIVETNIEVTTVGETTADVL
jgi:hypothetical protein